MKRFLADKNGAIALILAIIAPLIVALLALSFDGGNLLLKQARLQDALREAALGANTLSSEGEKRKFIESYLKVYFNNKNMNFSNISNTKTQSTKKSKEEIDTAEIINSYAQMSLNRWFKINLTKEASTTLSAKVSIEPTNGVDPNVDYVFAMDFSSSMKESFFTKTSKIGFCKPDSPDYDEIICNKLKVGANRAEVMQIVIQKIIQTINATPNHSSKFAFLPFYAGSQIKKPFTYNLNMGGKNTEQSQEASYYALQVTFKPEYRLSDYDFWSGVMPIGSAVIDNHRLTFDTPPYSTHEERSNAMALFKRLTRPKENLIHTHIENNLPKIIDYEETLKNMFDPNKIFSFRFYGFQDFNSFIPEARINGVAYDYYGDKKNISKESMRKLDMKFYEQDFKRIDNPKILDILNLKPFDSDNLGGGLTLVSTAILRGAALLSQGKNKRRILVIITDGVDLENVGSSISSETDLLYMENKLFSMGMCEKIRNEYKSRGVNVDLFFINISLKNESKNTLKRWQKCAGEKNAAVVENIDEFLKTFKQFIFGNELGRFTNG
ncbi:hypothetical protein [Helicobacter cappadocius]|uniref:VWFA domain-containing protein n=1 Tax=Helicobacter cappadocius TaxID=3063998 RepID=A0AA90PI89_9HELI|nr:MULTISPECIES: hypothetical protein [unclassified Helicobacter]MDO7253117.1 hypothetical protein [Helicobacter sp. faydin-H75]MDP2538757.1 hypothetical protein [Helicobacter sp. faydin-H76]